MLIIAFMGYFYIFLTIFFTVFGQLILKWQVSQVIYLPGQDLIGKIRYITQLLSNTWVISAFFSAFMASLAWMLVLTKFELSFAYPFTSLSFVVILILGTLFFNEPFNLSKMIGVILVVLGLVIGSRS